MPTKNEVGTKMAQIDITKPKRRTYSTELKKYLVEQALTGERSIASIAQGHGINPNLLQKWIKAVRDEKITGISPTSLKYEPNYNLIEHESSFLPITIRPVLADQPKSQTTTPLPIITGIELQIPTKQTTPIKLSISQIDTLSLIELIRGLQ